MIKNIIALWLVSFNGLAQPLCSATQVINETPTAADIAPGNNGSYKWFSGQWYDSTPPDSSYYSTVGGVLAINLGGDLVSTPRDFSAGSLPELSGATAFHVEVDMNLSDDNADHKPAIWLMPAEHNGTPDDAGYDGEGATYERWMELDIHEGNFGVGGLFGTVHSWHGVYTVTCAPSNYCKTGSTTVQSAAIDQSVRHVFGATWEPQINKISWWLDGTLVGSTTGPNIPVVARKQNFYIILSALSHGANTDYQMFVHSVKAWTGSTCGTSSKARRKH